MSRSGRIPINIPESVEVKIDSGNFIAKGKLGELNFKFDNKALVSLKDNSVIINAKDSSKTSMVMWGTVRSRIFNVIQGVNFGFKKELLLNGVGYKAALKGKNLELLLGFSHPINFAVPDDVKIDVPKPTEITISGICKQKVGQIAANIRAFRKPEPYKGKGVKYKDEIIRRKEGKKKWLKKFFQEVREPLKIGIA